MLRRCFPPVVGNLRCCPALSSRRLQGTVYAATLQRKNLCETAPVLLFGCGTGCFVKVQCLSQCINVPLTLVAIFAAEGVPDLRTGHVVWFSLALGSAYQPSSPNWDHRSSQE